MGFWQGLVQSYDANYEAMQERYPLSTTTISNNTEDIFVITINDLSEFVKAYKIDKKGKNSELVSITIPVTEGSLARTSGACPHPIFDQFEYVKGEGKKFIEYIKQLEAFSCSSFSIVVLNVLFNYMKKCSISCDLKKQV